MVNIMRNALFNTGFWFLKMAGHSSFALAAGTALITASTIGMQGDE